MNHTPVGIDLGTSNSVLCAYINGKPMPIPLTSGLSQNGSCLMPSLVGFDRDTSSIVAGFAARNYAGDPTCFIQEAKRKIGTSHRFILGERSLTAQEVGAIVLKNIISHTKQVPDLTLPITEAIISVPANFTDAQRQATMDAAHIAGLTVPMLIPEPTAAALAYGIQNLDADEKIVVFDFGGGTLDISLLEMCGGVIDVERIAGDHQLGGKDIDDQLLQWVQKEIAFKYGSVNWITSMVSLKMECEKAKIALSKQYSYIISIPMAFVYKGQPTPLYVEINQSIFMNVIDPILRRASDCIDNLLRGDAKNRRVPVESISRVLMVGGSTYIPVVRQRVSELFKKEVSLDINPDLAVAMGACARAAIYKGVSQDDFMLADISPFSVGVEVIDGRFSVLLEKNAPIPSRSSHDFHLLHPAQTAVDIRVFQGNSQWAAENEFIGSKEIQNIPPSSTDIPRNLTIDFSFDISGILELGVTIPNTGITTKLELNPRVGRMSEADKLRAQEFIQNNSVNKEPESTVIFLETAPNYGYYKAILKRAHQKMEKTPSVHLGQAIQNLENGIVMNSSNLEDLEDTLTEILLDLED